MKEDPDAYQLHFEELTQQNNYYNVVCGLLFVMGVIIGYYVIP